MNNLPVAFPITYYPRFQNTHPTPNKEVLLAGFSISYVHTSNLRA